MLKLIPETPMYAIYAYIGVVLEVNVGIYGIHGVSGIDVLKIRNSLIHAFTGTIDFPGSCVNPRN